MEKQFEDEEDDDLLMSIIESEEDDIVISSIKPNEKMDYYQMQYMEEKHWYFKYRLDVLKGLTDRFLKKESKDIEILDIGVGTGTISKYLEKYGKCTHIENDKKAIEYNKKVNKDLKIIEATLPWNMSTLENKKFDYIVAYNVLEYIDKDEWAIEVLSKYLKPGGKILLSTLSTDSMLGATEKLYGVKRNYNLDKIELMFAKISLNPCFYTFFENSSITKKISNSTDKLLNEDDIFYNKIARDNDITYKELKENELPKVLKKKLKTGNQFFVVLDVMTEKEKKAYIKKLEKKNEVKMIDKIINKIVNNRNFQEELSEDMIKEDIEEFKEIFTKKEKSEKESK